MLITQGLRSACAAVVALMTLAAFGAATEIVTERPMHSDDLALTGAFESIPANGTGYVSRAALEKLPGVKQLHEAPSPGMAVADLTVVPLSSLIDALGLKAGNDGVVLRCSDRWESVLPLSFIREYEPYVLLRHNGHTPEEGWPTFSAVEGLAPYYVNVSSAAHPKFDGTIDQGMISATQMVEIHAINTAEHYAPFYEAPFKSLSPLATEGRAIFIRNCNNCHQGPGGVGGNTSQRPLVLLQTHATLNTEYFKNMVRNPKQFFPQTVMPKHEHFDDATFTKLIAFLSETLAASKSSTP